VAIKYIESSEAAVDGFLSLILYFAVW